MEKSKNSKNMTSSSIVDTSLKKSILRNEEKPATYYCCSCGKEYKNQINNFPRSHSELYAANDYYLPVCRVCLDRIFNHYTEVYQDEDRAIYRICQMFDIYFHKSILVASRKISNHRSRIHGYISKVNLKQYYGKTYDTTLDEERTGERINNVEGSGSNVSQDTIQFFGTGFTDEDYSFLQGQYDEWITRHSCETKSHEETFKAVCYAQLNLLKAQRTGNKVNEALKAFQDVLGTANLKPNQNVDNSLIDQNTFGTLIRKWENERPIPEPDPAWKDVDKIVKYINIFFKGHLCKMMGIKNSYNRMYEEEMSKYRVNKPQYQDDDEGLFDSVFGGDSNDKDS